MTRRSALVGAVSAMLVPKLAWADEVRTVPDGAATLAGFVDTLLPADAFSPAASALGVHWEIADFAKEVPGLDGLLRGGNAWLNATGGARFEALSEEDRSAVVAWMSGSERNEAPYRFFEIVRLLAVEFYYAHPEAIAGFPLNDAPQPRGYPPPWT